jgi:5-methylcytosine-specific restriction endonuclease McrA
MSKAWAGGSTRQWRKMRVPVLAQNALPKSQGGNDGMCQLAIPKVCTGQAAQVHHKLGKANGDDPRYLEAVCAACNRHVGDPMKYEPPHKVFTRW